MGRTYRRLYTLKRNNIQTYLHFYRVDSKAPHDKTDNAKLAEWTSTNCCVVSEHLSFLAYLRNDQDVRDEENLAAICCFINL